MLELRDPALVAQHSNGYCAIIGGYVVRDPALPALDGRYLFGDNCKAQINSVRLSAGHARDNRATGLWCAPAEFSGQALPTVMKKIVRHAMTGWK